MMTTPRRDATDAERLAERLEGRIADDRQVLPAFTLSAREERLVAKLLRREPSEPTHCAFCGRRRESEAPEGLRPHRFVVGVHGLICEDCIRTAYQQVEGSEGRERLGWVVEWEPGKYVMDGYTVCVWRNRAKAEQAAEEQRMWPDAWPGARLVPVYFGTPSDSPTGEPVATVFGFTDDGAPSVEWTGQIEEGDVLYRRASDSPERDPWTALRETWSQTMGEEAADRLIGELHDSPEREGHVLPPDGERAILAAMNEIEGAVDVVYVRLADLRGAAEPAESEGDGIRIGFVDTRGAAPSPEGETDDIDPWEAVADTIHYAERGKVPEPWMVEGLRSLLATRPTPEPEERKPTRGAETGPIVDVLRRAFEDYDRERKRLEKYGNAGSFHALLESHARTIWSMAAQGDVPGLMGKPTTPEPDTRTTRQGEGA